MKYKVNEIFYSVQAEGQYAGHPAVFVRLCGCNLKCPWCDTKYHNEGTFYTKQELESAVQKLSKDKKNVIVVFTGGEPTLQLKDEEELLKGYRRHIETNGTRPVAKWIDYVTCSPKSDIDFKAMGRQPDEIKVICEKGREKYLQSLIPMQAKGTRLYLQPLELNGKMNIEDTMKFILQNPVYKLSLQFHKMIGVR